MNTIKYQLIYVTTRKEMADGTMVDLPVDKFKYTPTDYIFDDYNKADLMRCKLTEKMSNGFMKIEEINS